MSGAEGERGGAARVALETTLLVHGVPRAAALPLYDEVCAAVKAAGARAALVGVMGGRAVVGMSRQDLSAMLAHAGVAKVNTANLGLALAGKVGGGMGATTVSATMELAAGEGVRVLATGGIGGVHPPGPGGSAGRGVHIDVSADLAALTRFPLAVVASGVKSILDAHATREVLETLGVPVVGFGADAMPAFYLRRAEPAIGLDARFDDADALAEFVRAELARTGRGVLIVNPIPAACAIDPADWARWLAAAEGDVPAAGALGRDATPRILARLHEVSAGATLRANVELVKANAGLAGRLAVAMCAAAPG